MNQFTEYAETWWDRDGPMKPLHSINPVRLQFINEVMLERDSLNKLSVLDIGCGGGILSESLAEQGADVLGIDTDAMLLKVAREHAKQRQLNIEYQEENIVAATQFIKKYQASFDIVTCMELLEHCDTPQTAIAAIKKLVKKDGVVFCSTLNRNIVSYVTAILGAEYLFKILPLGTHQYDKFITPKELTQWAQDHNLSLLKSRGIAYVPWLERAWLTTDHAINYVIAFASN